MLAINEKAPNFTLTDKDGKEVTLTDYLGHKVVLYFYPRDNTPGCTRQACAFASLYEKFKEKDIVVIGTAQYFRYIVLKISRKNPFKQKNHGFFTLMLR